MGSSSVWFSSQIVLLAVGFASCIVVHADKNVGRTRYPADLIKKTDFLNAHGSYEQPSYHLSDDDFGGYLSEGHYYGNEHHHHHVHMQHHHSTDQHLKHFLLPLAGVALLGAAAIFASNPVLLQLGVISGKRRKRSPDRFPATGYHKRLDDIITIEKFIDKLPKEEVLKQEKKIMANYFACSGVMDGTNSCIERITCEVQNPYANITQLEKHVLNILTTDIMKNEYIKEGLKNRIKSAQRLGKVSGKCGRYYCKEFNG